MFLLILIVLIFVYLVIRLIPPIYYWKKRGITYVNPLQRIYRVFLDGKSFAEHVRLAYEEFPDDRYYGSYQFLKPSLFVRDIDLIKQLTVKDFDHFTDHVDILSSNNDPIFSKNLFTMKGKEWRELRTTLSPAFTSSKMRAMFVLITEAAKKFTQHFENLNQEIVEIEMKEAYSKFTNDVIATCAFGIDCDSLEEPENEFFLMGREVTRSSPFRMFRALIMLFFPKLFQIFRVQGFPEKVSKFFRKIITDTICVREEKGIVRPDLIHLLMEARKGKLSHDTQGTNDTGFATVQEIGDAKAKSSLEISDDVITAQALIFFLAGFETSSSLLSFISYELAKNPEIQQKLLEEIDKNSSTISYDDISKMKYLDQVVSEALRKWTPGFALNRVCTKEYTIQPKNEKEKPLKISKGCFLMIPVMGIHHDPKYFPNPDKFDPERFNDENKRNIVPGTYLPFGTGPRNCIGSRFALLEIKAVLHDCQGWNLARLEEEKLKDMYSNNAPDYKEFEDDRYLFTDQTIRKNFIRKVYSILMIQMLVALAFIAWFLYDIRVRFYVETNLWPMILAFVVTFAVLIALMCCGEVRRKSPMNFILLGIFTLAESFVLATFAAMYNSKTVMLAVLITTIVFLGLTVFSFQTRWDFTTSGGFLCVAVIVLMVFGLLVMFFPGRLMMMIYSAIGALIFGCYMVYDTQMLMGGDHQFALSPEEYIFAVLALYLDIINFFLFILTFLGASRR